MLYLALTGDNFALMWSYVCLWWSYV